ncbi:MAG: DUF2207 domain-containing protein [Firmicutes bacterium]|nr:DUF2207 domain-containing protein [Bacillota bacterium]
MSRLTSAKNLRAIGLLIIALFLFAGTADVTLAAERETKSFNVDIKVGEDNSYEFTEALDTVFNSPGHGIYRYVPIMFNGVREKVGEGWASGVALETYEENSNYVLQMGSADIYLQGDQKFKYGYKIAMLDDRDTSSDLLYMNVLPTNWQTPIGSATITMELPKSIKGRDMKVYYGKKGSTQEAGGSRDDLVSYQYDDSNKTLTIKGSDLAQGVGITVMIDLPEGYWVGQANTNWAKYAAALLLALLTALFGILWRIFGRMAKPIETVEFYPPEGLTPAEAGYMVDGSLDRKDMVSMFLYFADKGYMTITPKGKKDFILEKVKDIDENEKKFAKVMFSGIFPGSHTKTTLSDLDKKFAEKYQSAKAILDDTTRPVPLATKLMHGLMKVLLIVACFAVGFLAEAYVSTASGASSIFPLIFMGIFALLLGRSVAKRRIHEGIVRRIPFLILFAALDLIFLALSAVFLYEDFGGILMPAVFVVCALVSQYFLLSYNKVSKETQEYLGRLLGLRRFIETAEAPRINALVEENPSYFYNILPYAYVMGVTNKWAKKFENINVNPPEWYRGDSYDRGFNSVYFMHSVNNFGSAVNSNARFTIPDTSDSGGFSGGGGGFSGGGFSGGGGGGGGGGFW